MGRERKREREKEKEKERERERERDEMPVIFPVRQMKQSNKFVRERNCG